MSSTSIWPARGMTPTASSLTSPPSISWTPARWPSSSGTGRSSRPGMGSWPSLAPGTATPRRCGSRAWPTGCRATTPWSRPSRPSRAARGTTARAAARGAGRPRTPGAPPGSGRGPEPEMQADGDAGAGRAQLDQVAELVDDPQAVAAGAVGGGAAAAGQVVADVAAVVDLAEQLAVGGPDVQRAAGIRVTPGVRGQLADRDHQVAGAAGGQPGPACMLGGKRPDLGQVVPVGEGGGPAGRFGQPPVMSTGWVRSALAMTSGASRARS